MSNDDTSAKHSRLGYLFSPDFHDYCYHAYGRRLWFYILLGVLAVFVSVFCCSHALLVIAIVGLCAVLPVILFRILKWRFSERPYPLGSVLTLIVAIQLLTIVPLTLNGKPETASVDSSTAPPETSTDAPSSWVVAHIEDHSRKAIVGPLSAYSYDEIQKLPVDRKMTYSIVIPSMVNNSQVQAIMDEAITKITSDDPDIDELVLDVYSNKDEVIGQRQDIGEAIWAYEGKLGGMTPEIVTSNDRTNYSTTYKFEHNDLLSYLESKNRVEVRNGLPQAKRMAIYKALMSRTNDIAVINGQWAGKHPNASIAAINAQYDAMHDKVMGKIRKEFKVSDKALDRISEEGSEKHWPMGLKDED